MTATGRPILADYVRFGWALVPIPLGQKGPQVAGWNRREMCLLDPEVAEWIDGNIGLAHAYSGTCAIDIDSLPAARTWLENRGILLDELLNSPTAVRIDSGRGPDRAKLIYKVPAPMPSFSITEPDPADGNKRKAIGLEFRCASSTGMTVQDVLPPSIHPDTGKPYVWRYGADVTHWSQVSFIPERLWELWQTLTPKVASPKPRATVKARTEVLPELRKLLERANPDISYPEWLRIGMAIHHETKGSDDGLAIWNEWSANGEKYKGIADLEVHWRTFKIDHDNPATLAGLRLDAAAFPDEFRDLDSDPAPAGLQAPLSASETQRGRDLEALRSVKRSKQGTIEARISNVVAVLGVPAVSGYELALDEFQDAVLVTPEGETQWRLLTDADYVQMRIWLETVGNCDPIPHEMMRQAVLLVAERNRMDSARQWLESLRWDGKERIERFCSTHFGTTDERYTRAASLYLWTALAGRVMDPGCQADMVPTFIGPQGCGKSRGVQALVPSHEHYVELRLDEPDDAIARKSRGVLVAEFAEMRGLRAADVERVKAFITRTHEKWVPKYREFATLYARRHLIVGTTNDEEFLPVDDAHRRWLPMHTQQVDVARIREDRDQLWAEALIRWTVDGVYWQGMDELAADARAAASSPEAWADEIIKWVGEYLRERDSKHQYFKMHDLLTLGIGLDSRTYKRGDELRAGRVLREMGFQRVAQWEAGRTIKVWKLANAD